MSVESKAPGWLHVALAVVSGVVALAACAPLAGATLPGRNGEIAYGIVDEIDSSDGIYFAGFYIGAVDPRSGRQHRIGRHIDDDGLDAIEPAYSPDGSLLAVQWDDEPGWGIVLTRPDGTPVRRLTRKHDRSPTWAPGGRRLAFDRRRCGDEQCESLGIHTIGTRGKNRRLVVDDGVDPAWSARGEIAFVAEPQPWRFYDNQGPIQVTDSHGTTVRRLVDEGSAPDWSPGGDRLTFVRSRGEYSGLFVVKADGTGLRRLRVTERGSFGSPVWSPDGRRIAFLWGDELHTIAPSGRDRRRVRAIDYEYDGMLARVDHLDWQPLLRDVRVRSAAPQR